QLAVNGPPVVPVIGVIMTNKTAFAGLLALALLLGIGGGLWWTFRTDPTATGASADPTSVEVERAVGAAQADTANAPAQRITVPQSSQPTFDSRGSITQIVAEVHVSDDHGRGVRGATVTFFSEDAESSTTDANGDAKLRLTQPRWGALYTVAPGFVKSIMESV